MTPKLILFDLGGVLADLGSPAEQMELSMSDEQFWQIWSSSRSVRSFEKGDIGAEEFLAGVSRDLGLSEETGRFLQRFRRWHLTLFPGVDALLTALSETADLALLSNTNELHWSSIKAQSSVFERFSHLFLSYEIGSCKPDDETYEKVLDTIAASPSDVVFLDDSRQNVEAARRFGINAVHIASPADVGAALNACGIQTIDVLHPRSPLA